MNRGGFSWKTFFGVTAAKRKQGKILGCPLSKTGRRNAAWNGNILALIITLFFD